MVDDGRQLAARRERGVEGEADRIVIAIVAPRAERDVEGGGRGTVQGENSTLMEKLGVPRRVRSGVCRPRQSQEDDEDDAERPPPGHSAVEHVL